MLLQLLTAAAAGAAPLPAARPPVTYQSPAAADTTRVVDTARAADTVPARRPRAVEYSEAYGRRLAVHRVGSYVMLPLFGAQYALGGRLLTQKQDVFAGRRTTPVDARLRRTHAVTAAGVGALFAVNTVTGAMNWWEGRRDPNGRARRTTHALTMLAADAGFVATGLLGARATDHAPRDARRHRTVALSAMGVAAAGAAMMWLWRD